MYLPRKAPWWCLADVDYALAQKSAEDIKSNGGKAWAVQCDVSTSSSVIAMVDASSPNFGRIDVAHVNAASAN